MKLNDLIKKINVKNIAVAFLIIVVHVVALFASPFFLGPNYSKQVLIDEYCSNNSNGSSLVLSSDLDVDSMSYENILGYRENNDVEFNTITGIAYKNAVLDEGTCNLIGATKSSSDNHYNQYRVYSENGWNYLKQNDYVYVPLTMASKLASNPKEVVNSEIDISIKGVLYTFKIGGYYDNKITNSGWRSRGTYLNDCFDNCIFVSETFLEDKYDCVFEMFTSDSSESGNIYSGFKSEIAKYNGNILQPKDLREINLLKRLSLLDKTQRNKTVQIIFVVSSSVVAILILFISTFLFNVNSVQLKNRWKALFAWGLIYYVLSCIFVFIVRNKIIGLLGFTAYGGNKALLNILLIFFVAFLISIVVKTFLKYKKDQTELKQDDSKSVNSIIFITKAKFPDDNAFATYIGGIASVYKNAGYDVICIGNGSTDYNKYYDSYFGKYVSVRRNGNSFISKVLSQLFFESRVYRLLENNFEKPTHIFFSCEFSVDFYNKIKKLYSDSDVRFSFILTEEYTKDEFEKYNFLAKRSLSINRYFINKYYDKNDSFIVISKYLLNKIENKKMECVYVPFSFNPDYIASIKKESIKHKGINYIYCGSPENKDLLPTIINAFSSLDLKLINKGIHLNVIGVDEEWARRHGVASYNKDIVTLYGRQNRIFVSEKYAESDYSVLLRDENKTFAKAGFPTKISESMMFGVVPIANLSSNLGDYLDNSNSIIVNGHELDDFINAIHASINEVQKLSSRKKKALDTSHKFFNVEFYKDSLISLIKNK